VDDGRWGGGGGSRRRIFLLTFAVIKKRAFAEMEILRSAQNDVSYGASGGYVTLSEANGLYLTWHCFVFWCKRQ